MKIRLTKEPEWFFVELISADWSIIAYAQWETFEEAVDNLIESYDMLEDTKHQEIKQKLRYSLLPSLTWKLVYPVELAL